MSYAMEETTPEMIGSTYPDAGASNANIGSPVPFRIVRAGARPIKFSGSELAMAMSYTPTVPYWYEINLYRSVHSRFVAAIRHFYCSEEQRDTVEAWEFDSLDEALTAIEYYDAGSDVEAVLHEATSEACAAEVSAQALELRARIELKRQHYRGLVGEILYELEAV